MRILLTESTTGAASCTIVEGCEAAVSPATARIARIVGHAACRSLRATGLDAPVTVSIADAAGDVGIFVSVQARRLREGFSLHRRVCDRAVGPGPISGFRLPEYPPSGTSGARPPVRCLVSEREST
jgi:hypothetical protein